MKLVSEGNTVCVVTPNPVEGYICHMICFNIVKRSAQPTYYEFVETCLYNELKPEDYVAYNCCDWKKYVEGTELLYTFFMEKLGEST